MRTVERRSCSAISPKPGMAMLFGSMRALANDDRGFLEGPAAHEFNGERFADGFRAELPVNIFEARDRMTGESHKNIADDDAGFVCGAFRLDLEHDGRGPVVAFECFSKRVRQTHGLQTDAEVAARNAAFLQKHFNDAVHRGCRNRASAAPVHARRSATTRLTAPRAATGPLARVRPTTRARLPGLIEETSLASPIGEPASAHFKTAKSVDASRPARVAATTRPSGKVV